MKEIKKLLFILYIAICTSCWWIWAICKDECNKMLVLLPVASTVPIIILALVYLIDHWNDDKNLKP